MQIHLASLGANVFYFLIASKFRMLKAPEPFASEALAQRRKALVEFLGQAIFTDRRRGAALAAKVLADTPMPEVNPDRLMFRQNGEHRE
jgi:hypothetical protein